jgi:hypothetical protein
MRVLTDVGRMRAARRLVSASALFACALLGLGGSADAVYFSTPQNYGSVQWGWSSLRVAVCGRQGTVTYLPAYGVVNFDSILSLMRYPQWYPYAGGSCPGTAASDVSVSPGYLGNAATVYTPGWDFVGILPWQNNPTTVNDWAVSGVAAAYIPAFSLPFKVRLWHRFYEPAYNHGDAGPYPEVTTDWYVCGQAPVYCGP